MAIKSAAEIALIRESVRWGNLAHRLLQRYTRVGVTETEVSQRASDEATFAMLDAIGEIYRARASSRAARTPATGDRSAATPRSRTRLREISCSKRAMSSSREPALPFGGTSRSSSGRCSWASRHPSRSGCSRTCWRRSGQGWSSRSSPGLYSPELGGFRHSDTVLVTEDGIEILTYYPRDLASLIIPA
jgi:hypothetical protein